MYKIFLVNSNGEGVQKHEFEIHPLPRTDIMTT